MLVPNLRPSNREKNIFSENPLFADRDYRLWALLHQTRHTMHEALKKEMQPLGVSPRQVAALLIIEAIDKPATPSRISYWLMRDRASVSVLLDRMERKGLINKTRDPDNKNSIEVTLTAKGKRVYNRIISSEMIHEMFSALSDEQHQQLMNCLDLLWGKALEVLGCPKPELPYT
jgi:DNA-binding MarR family transcriptional regulator